MPHKHKRQRRENDDHYDLPPSKVAKPLSTRPDKSGKPKSRGKNAMPKDKPADADYFGDDTPRQFARMMRKFQQSVSVKKDRGSVGSDSELANEKDTRKRKREGGTAKKSDGQKSKLEKGDAVAQSETSTSIPKILPGEKLSEYSIRVDQAVPLAGASRKAGGKGTNKVDADIRNLREHRQTKHEKRLLRLQSQWREEEARLRDKEEAEREEKEAEDEEVNETWRQWEAEAGKGSKKKKNKKKRPAAGADGLDASDDDDPWGKLNKKKRASRSIDPFDVAQAPPEKLTKVKEIFKVHGMGGAKVHVANVPTAAGSLRRREELASERQNIVEEYRRIMAAKRS